LVLRVRPPRGEGMHMSEAVISGLGMWGFCINSTELRPFCVRFMQVWPLMTVKGVSFMHES
jgi:hypothetical protein